MPTKTDIALELVRTRSDISFAEKEINDSKWAIIQVQAQKAAALAIIQGNYPHDRIAVAKQQYSEFLNKECDLQAQQSRTRRDLERLRDKETRLERELRA
ncbi:hypothetical protein FVEG_11733 [Fusarium verticillioides 7600]|uniref:Uncharacterized protein n=1 Tax=Gibberella moniliformis (strain M3125 / FGSC 7600) TaxID=334819 RepID=W7MZN1_GIBM7|nr:hypothetical protein FVEG_11733 [Fusarium verticillioides 7600]EWG53264.1 hypothetical protein FVEG_11733 [Fusarium verticillioides 7600]